MTISQEILEFIHDTEKTNAEIYFLLKRHWDNGNKNREIGLHLMFHAWYGMADPWFSTGFEQGFDHKMLRDTLLEVHDYFQQNISDDAEMLFVVGLMASIFPYLFGNEEEWKKRDKEYRNLFLLLAPDGISETVFENRGWYGHYFGRNAKYSHLKEGY